MGLALYRTYRPGSLGEVIGQEHVTDPLSRALDAGRVHHAYLFSGPRGCGKTSTARIIARSLNCDSGPTASPCGDCRSCVELAPNGPGSIDVVELDAATHRGIDDARDLREKAVYAPAASRYKIYIIDEAHQLTNEAANALLKLVEEPPAHLRFIFATTEPDKIIPTIRSRTFHYGFRLVPAKVLVDHLARVCESEDVPAEPAALAVVARAGAGSVRDSLSVLGQLLAGAGPEGLTYADAVSALGLTDAGHIDGFVAALAAGSAADMFGVVEGVVTAGHDPRRFVTDVLERLRDLLIIHADPSALSSGLVDVPDDAGDRMRAQAASLSLAELSRAADLVSAGLTDIKGATAPRLQLELLCARLALPSVTGDPSSLVARLDRLERALSAGVPASASPAPHRPVAGVDEPGRAGQAQTATGGAPGVAELHDPGVEAERPPARPASGPPEVVAPAAPTTTGSPAPSGPSGPATGAGAPPAPPRRPPLRSASTPQLRASGSGESAAVTPDPATRDPGTPGPATRERVARSGEVGADDRPRTSTRAAPLEPAPAAAPPARAASGDPDSAAGDLTQIRAQWPEVLARLASDSRVAWTAFHGGRPVSLSQGVLAVAIAEAGHVRAIAARGHDERLRQALIDVLGQDLGVDIVHDPGVAGPGSTDAQTGGAGAATGRSPSADVRSTTPASQVRAGAGTSAMADSVTRRGSEPGGLARAASALQHEQVDHPDEPSPDDPDLEGAGGGGLALVARELGARPIGEIDHS